jgi:uncharacterized protein (DUF2336 family)
VKRAGRLSDAELAKFADLSLRLLGQVQLIERMAFARQLAKHRATPRALLTKLTNDHYLVSAPVLESAPMLSESDLNGLIDRYGNTVFLAIAKRDELSVQLTDKLMTDSEPKVRQTLAGNTGARLSRKTMTALCDAAEDDETMRAALSRRRDLPLNLVNRLRAQRGAAPIVETQSVPQQPAGSSVGRGRAGVVLGADMLRQRPTRRDPKTFPYS